MSTNKLIGLIIASIIAITVTLTTVQFKSIKGNEIGVMETWTGGVMNEPLPPKTYTLFPGFMKTVYTYPISQQVFVMNDKNDRQEPLAEGRRGDSYLVQSKEGQDMRISLAVQWRRDISKVVELHKTVRDNIEERILRPELMRVVKDEATVFSALDAYSGDGLVQLQRKIHAKLSALDGDLQKKGIIVDNFVIEHIALDEEYVKQIKARQVAVQAKLRNDEETKAATAAAEKAKAEAQADYEKAVVEARRDKQVGVLQAEKEAEQRVLSAEAEAKAGQLRGEGIIAIGKAEAEAIKLKMLAYSSSGADNFVKMEVAKNLADAYKNIKGYLPGDMNVNLLTENFDKSVNILMSGQKSE